MLFDLYKQFLKLYPDTYQKKYGRQMLQTMQDIVINEQSATKRRLVLIQEIIATPLNALEQYLVVFSERRHVTPKLVVSLIAVLLLVPFFLAIAVDEIAEFVGGTHLYDTWLWSPVVLWIWIVILPFISLTASLSVYVISLARQHQQGKKLTPLAKKYWLMIVTMLFSAGILWFVVFHDSVHCWLGTTPINNVLSCTEAGILGGDSH